MLEPDVLVDDRVDEAEADDRAACCGLWQEQREPCGHRHLRRIDGYRKGV